MTEHKMLILTPKGDDATKMLSDHLKDFERDYTSVYVSNGEVIYKPGSSETIKPEQLTAYLIEHEEIQEVCFSSYSDPLNISSTKQMVWKLR